MATLSLRDLSKRFGQSTVVDAVSIDIASGEFFSILGPSGCGKTTLLRMIAGFEQPTGGDILLDGKVVTGVAPQFRGIGMVFQNYALFPHRTAGENVAFGLETLRVGKSEVDRRVRAILALVGMEGKKDVPVPMLSGGEQQRVAVARALVVEPSVLLFDEPLSNLDVALRQQTRDEIRSIQRATGITTVYVTHDQAEAMSLSDRIGVMRSGRIVQQGPPTDLYESPATAFVANFLGAANLLRGTLEGSTGRFVTGEISAQLPPSARNGDVVVAVRPEFVRIDAEGPAGIPGAIRSVEYLGYTTQYVVVCSGVTLRGTSVSGPQLRRLKPGLTVGVTIDWGRCVVFPGEG